MWGRIRSIVGPGLAVALVWLASLGTANAILVRGGIDPTFSTTGALADLYWTALIQFDLAPSCLSPSSTVICPISNLSVTGTLQYKPSPGTPGPVLPVDFLSHDLSPPTSLSLAVDGSDQIIGIGSDPLGYASVDMRPSLDIGNVWVQFFLPGSDPNFPHSTVGTGGLIVQQCTSGSSDANEEEDNESETAQENENEDGGDACNAGTSPAGGLTSSVLGVVNITQVPEPGSLWLVLGALFFAAPLLARRKPLR